MATAGTIVANLIANTTKFNQAMKQSRGEVRQLRNEVGGLSKASVGIGLKKLSGGVGLIAGLAGESIGGTPGRLLSAAGNIAGAAALGGLAGGPLVAAITGSIAALKEFKDALHKTTKVVDLAKQDRERREKLIASQQFDESIALTVLMRDPQKALEKQALLKRAIPEHVLQQQNAALAEQTENFAKLQEELRKMPAPGQMPGLSKRESIKERVKLQNEINAIDQELVKIREDQAAMVKKFLVARLLAGPAVRGVREQGGRFLGGAQTSLGSIFRQAESAARLPMNRFAQQAAETFANLTEAVLRWKMQVKATTDAAKELNLGNIGQFKTAIRLLSDAKRLTNEERRAGLLAAFDELKDASGLTQIGDATGPLKGTNEALDEILRVTRENPTEKQVLEVAEAQLKEQERMAEKLARELERLGVAGIKQANF